MVKQVRNLVGSLLFFCLPAVAFFGSLSVAVNAQSPFPIAAPISPKNPTSFDHIIVGLSERTCAGQTPYITNPYQISMEQNKITVKLGIRRNGVVPTCAPGTGQLADLGKLPPGDYTISILSDPNDIPGDTIDVNNAPFTVTDGRRFKTAPFVRLDYNGLWWDPSDPGWGLFIWQDNNDNVLAAWFTFAADGKPMWNVFQPKFKTGYATFDADLLQASRLPGSTSPPPGPNTNAVVGTASLDFTTYEPSEAGKIIYTYNGGPTLTRTIQRFKP